MLAREGIRRMSSGDYPESERRKMHCNILAAVLSSTQRGMVAGGGGSEATHKSGDEITKGRLVTEARKYRKKTLRMIRVLWNKRIIKENGGIESK
jgi:uncharacterized protein HemY